MNQQAWQWKHYNETIDLAKELQKDVTASIPHDFEYDFEHAVWVCVRCPYSTPSQQIAHPGCAPMSRVKTLPP